MNRYSGLSRIKLFDEQKRINRKEEMTPEIYLELDDAFKAREADWSTLQRADADAQRLKREGELEPAFKAHLDELRGVTSKPASVKQKMAGGMDFSDVTGSDIFSNQTADNLSSAYTQLMSKANEYGRLNRDLNDAGINTPGPIQELDTGVLKGGAPGPVRDFSQGNEIRRFLDWEDNAITGRKERVPFLDPSNGMPLSQEFGMLPIDGRNIKANELIQLAALKLAGYNASPNNQTRGLEHYSDHIVDLGNGKNKRVEGKIRVSNGRLSKTDNIPIEGVKLNNSSLEGRAMSEQVSTLIQDKMMLDNIDMIEATEQLIKDEVLSPPGRMEQRLGKILRSDPSFMTDPDGLYDQLIVTAYPSELQRPERNRPGSSGERRAKQFNTDKLAVAPDNVMLIEYLAAAREWLKSGKGKDGVKDVLVTPNGGHSGKGKERAFVQGIIPINAKYRNQPIYTDLAVKEPNVRQLLSKLEYEKSPRTT